MKILILSDGIPPYILGGMQRHTFNLVKFLVKNGVEVTLIHCFNEGQKEFSKEEVCQEIFGTANQENFSSTMISFPKPTKIPGHYIRRSYKYSEKVYLAVKDQIDLFDFVYIKGFSGWKFLEKKKDFKTKMGVNFHGYEMFQDFPDFKTKLKNQILIKPVRKNIEKADFVFSYGGGIDQLLIKIGVPKTKIISIQGAVDQTWLEPVEVNEVKEPLKLLFVGRFERRKGIQEINNLLPSLLEKHNFEFSFVGPIPTEHQIQHEKVNYLGEVKEVDQLKKIYKKNDVLIAPSYSEGMPNVIMEAMSQGLAILATDVGATSLLVNKENGWLMSEMSLSVLQNYLQEILESDQRTITQKKQSSKQKLNKEFSWNEVAKQHVSSIKSASLSHLLGH